MTNLNQGFTRQDRLTLARIEERINEHLKQHQHNDKRLEQVIVDITRIKTIGAMILVFYTILTGFSHELFTIFFKKGSG